MTLRTLPLPLKVLASFFLLTIGYLLALTYLYLIDLEPHTQAWAWNGPGGHH